MVDNEKQYVETEVKKAVDDLFFGSDIFPTNDIGFHGVKIDFNYGCRVLVPEGERLKVVIYDDTAHTILHDATMSGEMAVTERKYFVRYKVVLTDDASGEEFTYDFNLEGKKVLIRFPKTVLGDVISWFGTIEEFRKKQKCEVIVSVSDIMEKMFSPVYKNLKFCDNTFIPEDRYATYYLGIFFPTDNRAYQPYDFRHFGLHFAAANILGMPTNKEYHTRVHFNKENRQIKEPYVCISVQSTTQCKYWNNIFGWVDVISFLKKMGYRVICIDRDNKYGTGRFQNVIPFGCEDFTGNIPLTERADMIANADFFIGLSSGLSWLAWAVDVPIVLISGFTLPHNEFYTPYRIFNNNACNGCWNYDEFKHDEFGFCPKHKGTDREFECSRLISPLQVEDAIKQLMEDHKLIAPNER